MYSVCFYITTVFHNLIYINLIVIKLQLMIWVECIEPYYFFLFEIKSLLMGGDW